jgi:ABC-type multidrug transport system permease subunit
MWLMNDNVRLLFKITGIKYKYQIMNLLHTVWLAFRRHPYSISLYIIYVAFFGRLKYVEIWLRNQKNMPHAWKLMDGEGIMYGYFFATIFGVIFIMVIMACLIAYKAQMRFYGWLLALMIVSLIAMWQL